MTIELRADVRLETPQLLDGESRLLGLPIHDVQVKESLLNKLADAVDECIKQETLAYGIRTEKRFAYVVHALGKTSLIKEEDRGDFFTYHDNLAVPDYRILLEEDIEIFVEVKNCHRDVYDCSATNIEKLSKYAELFNKKLYVAIYWSKYKYWSLLLAEDFELLSHKYRISWQESLKKSRMSMLGEALIKTRLPFSVTVAWKEEFEDDSILIDSCFDYEVEAISISYGESYIKNKQEKDIAYFLCLYGELEENKSLIKMKNNKYGGMKLNYCPQLGVDDSGFQIIGLLGTMLSKAFDQSTTASELINCYTPRENLLNIGKLISAYSRTEN